MGLLTWVCHCRVLANVLFPNWLVTGLLLGLLIFLTYKTAKKALSLHRCEVRYLAQREEQKFQSSKNRKGQGLGSEADAGEARMKALAPQPSLGRTGALPGDLAAQADIDRDTREALALSAAGRLGSCERLRSSGQLGSSEGETGSGSSRLGAWQQAAEEPPSAQVSPYASSGALCFVYLGQGCCASENVSVQSAVATFMPCLSPGGDRNGCCAAGFAGHGRGGAWGSTTQAVWQP